MVRGHCFFANAVITELPHSRLNATVIPAQNWGSVKAEGLLGHRSPSRPRLHSAPQKPCVGATVLGKYGAKTFDHWSAPLGLDSFYRL